jgi:ABC-type multidrug transport system fused ATPase/permease subunit
MTASWKYAKEIFFLLGDSSRQLPKMLGLFLFSGFLDVAGLGLIAPYVALVIDPSAIETSFISKYLDMVGGLSVSAEHLILILGGLLLVLYFLKAVAAYFINRSILRFSWGQQVRLRNTLMEAYQGLPYSVYVRRNSSEYIYSILGLTGRFSTGVVMNGLKVVSDGIIGLSILSVLAAVNGVALTLLVTLIGTTVLGYDLLLKKTLNSLGKKVVASEQRVTKAVQEGIRGFKEIRVIGAERLFSTIVSENSQGVAQASTLRDLIMGVPRYLLEFVLFLFVVLLVTAAINFDYQREALIPTLSLFGVGALRLIPVANSFSKSLMLFRFNRYTTSRLYSDVYEIKDVNTHRLVNLEKKLTEPFLSLEAKNITFSYEGANNPTLLNLNFEINAGETIGVMGPSGSGKTTFIDTILGLLEPQEGVILVNKTDLKSKLLEWRAHVAYLPQDGFIIDDSLRRNITLDVNDRIDEDRLQQVLHQAQLLQLVDGFPNGTETMLGESGIRLSGGQRQRVSIARALYRNRQVLIMDEATSALDDETENEIVDEIERLKGMVTTLVIAHRLSTLRHCDRVYCLKGGKLEEVDVV